MKVLAWNIPLQNMPMREVAAAIKLLDPDIFCLFGAAWPPLIGHPANGISFLDELGDNYANGHLAKTHRLGRRQCGTGVFWKPEVAVCGTYQELFPQYPATNVATQVGIMLPATPDPTRLSAVDLTAVPLLAAFRPQVQPAIMASVWPARSGNLAQALARTRRLSLWPYKPLRPDRHQVFIHALPGVPCQLVPLQASQQTGSRIIMVEC